jgi:hypothetical protein
MITPYQIATIMGFTSSTVKKEVRRSVRAIKGFAPEKSGEDSYEKHKARLLDTVIFDLEQAGATVKQNLEAVKRNGVYMSPALLVNETPCFISFASCEISDKMIKKMQVYMALYGQSCASFFDLHGNLIQDVEPDPTLDCSLAIEEYQRLVDAELDNIEHMLDKSETVSSEWGDRYALLQSNLDTIKTEMNNLKEQMILEANVKGLDKIVSGGYQLIKSKQKGRVNKDAMLKDLAPNWKDHAEEYTGEPSVVWMIKKKKITE